MESRGAAVDEGSGADAVLTFSADYSEAISAPLEAGGRVRISYDASRTPCTSYKYGQPAYSVLAHWRLDGGDVQTLQVAGFESYPGAIDASFVLPGAGDLELWFESSDVYGCHAWDSDFGVNYHFPVASASSVEEPAWMGNTAYVINRQTCGATACDSDRRSLDDGFAYDSYARQRAAVRSAFFDVWQPGVTDWDNPDLWQQLDARVYYRFTDGGDNATEWSFEYVNFQKRVGNDARYELPLRPHDVLGGYTRTSADQCPDVPLEVVEVAGTPTYVRTHFEFYFTVNGRVLQASGGTPFEGVFEDYYGLYTPCF
ncbi:MAG: hypothetical protein H6718_20320 [Polyangiaceae bacterium]|nr:hypothetical protein [Myxococcales bacterium]MCB9587760.1 hypothetical protein [Polyangiaceae bacterium]